MDPGTMREPVAASSTFESLEQSRFGLGRTLYRPIREWHVNSKFEWEQLLRKRKRDHHTLRRILRAIGLFLNGCFISLELIPVLVRATMGLSVPQSTASGCLPPSRSQTFFDHRELCLVSSFSFLFFLILPRYPLACAAFNFHRVSFFPFSSRSRVVTSGSVCESLGRTISPLSI